MCVPCSRSVCVTWMKNISTIRSWRSAFLVFNTVSHYVTISPLLFSFVSPKVTRSGDIRFAESYIVFWCTISRCLSIFTLLACLWQKCNAFPYLGDAFSRATWYLLQLFRYRCVRTFYIAFLCCKDSSAALCIWRRKRIILECGWRVRVA